MVANTQEKQLKIIQGGPDGNYVDQGTYESSTLDAGYTTTFNRFVATSIIPSDQQTLQLQFAIADAVSGSCNGANYVFTGPDGNTNTYYSPTSGAIYLSSGGNGYVNPGRCFKYKVYMSTTDYNTTPVLQDISVNYSP